MRRLASAFARSSPARCRAQCRPAAAREGSVKPRKEALPLAPWTNAIQVLVSTAINDPPSAPPLCERNEPCRGVGAVPRRPGTPRPAAGPVRTVWVMPLPVARCAFSRSSGETSIVILRAVSMPQNTISYTSIEYGRNKSRRPASNRLTLIYGSICSSLHGRLVNILRACRRPEDAGI